MINMINMTFRKISRGLLFQNLVNLVVSRKKTTNSSRSKGVKNGKFLLQVVKKVNRREIERAGLDRASHEEEKKYVLVFVIAVV